MDRMFILGRALEAIEAQLPLTSDQQAHRLLRVKKADLLTKIGRIEEARNLVAQLRLENQSYEPKLAGWIMFVEGLIQHFGSLDVNAARDRLRRSYAVAVAVGDSELRAISAAWLADSDYRLTNYESACERLKEAFRWADKDCHEAHSRACLVIASMLILSGDIDLGGNWYRKARMHAVTEGDIGMQSVMLFNSVSTRASALMIDDCTGSDVQAKAESLLAELNSVRNLDQGLGIRTLGTMIPTLEAEILTMLRRWPAAIEKFESVVNSVGADGQACRAPRYFSQLAWCHANRGEREGSLVAIRQTIKDVENCSDIDDIVILYSRLAATFGFLGMPIEKLTYKGYADRAMVAFLEFRRSLHESLSKLLSTI